MPTQTRTIAAATSTAAKQVRNENVKTTLCKHLILVLSLTHLAIGHVRYCCQPASRAYRNKPCWLAFLLSAICRLMFLAVFRLSPPQRHGAGMPMPSQQSTLPLPPCRLQQRRFDDRR